MTTELPALRETERRQRNSNAIVHENKSASCKLREMKKELELMSPTYLPKYYDFAVPIFNKDNYPESYKGTNSFELGFMKVVKNFNRQFKLEFRSRKALLLAPRNEFHVKKFICTYICPVQWVYPELDDWKGAASFVSDHLNFTPLLPSTELPRTIYSSTTILSLQIGNCFDFSILLCSLLIGVGFDAYVVSGYASRECCYVDQTRTPCPLLEKSVSTLPTIPATTISKYMVKPIKSFNSKYDMVQLAKKIKQKNNEEIQRKMEEKKAQFEAEKPKPDPLFGLRVHAWILVKAGQRDIRTDFFIETLTGEHHDLNTDIYQGIESLWNDKNYWVNKFCCMKGLKEIDFNLKNLFFWEPLLPVEHFILKTVKSHITEDEEGEPKESCKTSDMPLTWIRNLNVSWKDFEIRFPGFQKERHYYKVKQYMYSPYYCLSGLKTRLRIYDNMELDNLVEVHEFLDNREDKFYKCVIKNHWITEHFKFGNEYALKAHSYDKTNPGPENNREIEFYPDSRVDGLIKRIESPVSIEEFYKNRKDYLCYSYVDFVPRYEEESSEYYRSINYIIQKFNRNPLVNAEEDIAELTYQLNDDKIFVKYHIPEGCIIPNTREYIKPQPSTDGRNTIHLYSDTHTSFEADMFTKKKTNLEIYELLKTFIKTEKESIETVRCSENDTKLIILNRTRAKRDDKITISLYDTIRNFRAKTTRTQISHDFKTKLTTKEEPLDFLDPFFSQLHLAVVSRKEEAYMVREVCLCDLKHRLIMQADLIRSRFELETDQLQKRQTWYYQNKMMLSLEDEQVYLKYCSDTVALLDTLENLLGRHQQTAPHKYMELERRIRKDPRLTDFL